jgi:hypothetical protein
MDLSSLEAILPRNRQDHRILSVHRSKSPKQVIVDEQVSQLEIGDDEQVAVQGGVIGIGEGIVESQLGEILGSERVER